MSELLKGVWFVSSVSGLIYKNHDAAGDISCVIVEGKKFYPMEATKLTSAIHSDGEGRGKSKILDEDLQNCDLPDYGY